MQIGQDGKAAFRSAKQFITETVLRKIAREPRWDRQRALFEHFLPN